MEFTLEDIRKCIKEVLLEGDSKATLTIGECTKFTGIGRDKIMELARSKRADFPSFRVGNRFLINKNMLIEWLNKVAEDGVVL